MEQVERSRQAGMQIVSSGHQEGDAPLERLAICLFEEMNRLDSESGEWLAILPHERDFYRFCISAVLDRKDLVIKAIADNDSVNWHLHIGK